MNELTTIEKEFQSPSNIYRPVQIIHQGFPEAEKEMDHYIDNALQRGMGGFVVNVKAQWGEVSDINLYHEYLNTPNEWKRIKIFIDKCIEKNLRVWLYDESGFPSGAACRWVYESNPELFRVRAVECQNITTSGGTGSMELLEGECCGVFAYNVLENGQLDVTNAIAISYQDNVATWDLPKGNWLVAALIIRKIEWITYVGVPYVDLLNYDVVATFIDFTHERYIKNLGDETFSKIEAIFTDEPGLPTHGCSSVLNESFPLIPWTGDFKQEFSKLYNYKIEANFVNVFYETNTNYKTVRRDFWKMVARRFEQSYFKQIFDWCEKHNTKSTGHLYGEETLAMQIGLNGELFGLLRYMQMPGVDRLYCTNPQDVFPEKVASSAADLMGYNQTMSESSAHFERSFWNSEFDYTDYINSCTYQYVLGINNIASYFDLLQLPADDTRLFQLYLGRIAALMANGKHHANLLIDIPMVGAWERYTPINYKYWKVGPSHVSPFQCDDEKELEDDFGNIMLNLLKNQIDFDLIDDCGIEKCMVKEKKISTDYEQFDALIVFDCGYFEQETLDSIKNMLASDGKVIIVTLLNSQPCVEIQELIKNYINNIFITHASDILSVVKNVCTPDIFFDSYEPEIWFRHVSTENAHIYLVHNHENCKRELPVNINVFGNLKVYYPLSGVSISPKIIKSNAITKFTLELPPKSGVLIVVEK
jgi:hypothetical protein